MDFFARKKISNSCRLWSATFSLWRTTRCSKFHMTNMYTWVHIENTFRFQILECDIEHQLKMTRRGAILNSHVQNELLGDGKKLTSKQNSIVTKMLCVKDRERGRWRKKKKQRWHWNYKCYFVLRHLRGTYKTSCSLQRTKKNGRSLATKHVIHQKVKWENQKIAKGNSRPEVFRCLLETYARKVTIRR